MIAALLLAAGSTIVVQPGGPVRTLTEALARAKPGDRIVVRSGAYREPPIVVRVRVEIVGDGTPVLIGGTHSTLEIRADGVLVRGMTFAGGTASMIEDRAAIFVDGVRDCRIENNRIEVPFFGVYLRATSGCRVLGNQVNGAGAGGGAAA
ncbi:MAG TPA: DUF1565 domain-containing protein, partial [Gemmatimonadales bacterium]|nr:DUF1565 domain-containing protein [Gemmatimonadales bacterium]